MTGGAGRRLGIYGAFDKTKTKKRVDRIQVNLTIFLRINGALTEHPRLEGTEREGETRDNKAETWMEIKAGLPL